MHLKRAWSRKRKRKRKRIKSFSASTDDQINDFVNLINQMIDTDIDLDQLNDSALSKSQEYVTFKEKHCYANTYTFQVKNCLDGNCQTCSIQPPRLPMEVNLQKRISQA